MIALAERDTVLQIRCKCCRILYSITYNREDMIDWLSGEGFVQDVFYYLSPEERELLLSAVCGHCFDQMFPKEHLDFTK